jgi:hypothetical protein
MAVTGRIWHKFVEFDVETLEITGEDVVGKEGRAK